MSLEEQLVSFELAKLAYEKGFRADTQYIVQHNSEEEWWRKETCPRYYTQGCNSYPLPTYALIQNWLRTKYLDIIVDAKYKIPAPFYFWKIGMIIEDHEYPFTLESLENIRHRITPRFYSDYDNFMRAIQECLAASNKVMFHTYDKALESGLIHILNLL